MARGKRKFVLEITETEGLTVEEMCKCLSRLAGNLNNGRSSLEMGTLRDASGRTIGTYKWAAQLSAADIARLDSR